jgi:hypothetical protein
MRVTKTLYLLLLLPTLASATITATDRGVNGNTTAQSSTAMSPGSTIIAGSTGVLMIVSDNVTGTQTVPTSITDSANNTWTLRDSLTSNGSGTNCDFFIYTSYLTTQLTSGGSVTVTWQTANVTAKCWAFVEAKATDTTNNMVMFKNDSINAQNATASPAVTTNVVTINDLTVGCLGTENSDIFTAGGDADATNGTWSSPQHTGVGSGATGMSIQTQTKVQTTTSSTQQYNPTLTSGTPDNKAVFALFSEVPKNCRRLFDRGTNEATTTIPITDPLTAGSTGVLIGAWDNNGASGTTTILPSSISDSKSNTWTLRQDTIYAPVSAQNSGVEIGIYTSTLTSNLVSGDTIAMTYTASATCGTKQITMWEFASATSGYSSSGVGLGGTANGANTSTPSVTTGSITSGNYVVGLIGFEDNLALDTVTEDSDSSNGTWSKAAITGGGAGGSGGGLTNIGFITQWKLVTGTATQTYNLTIALSRDADGGWVELAVPAAASNAKTGMPSHPNVPKMPSM